MMKYRSIMATVLSFALTGQLAIAGSIADTYATGDALTVQILNNIKTAVNDNDTQITSLKSGIVSVGALVGVPRNSACPTKQRTVIGSLGRSADNISCGVEFMVAPVFIPDGATVTAFRCVVYDLDGVNDSLCYLFKDTAVIMANVRTTGSSGIQTISSTSIIEPVISNSTTSYFVYFEINGNAINTLVPIRAVIEYTLP